MLYKDGQVSCRATECNESIIDQPGVTCDVRIFNGTYEECNKIVGIKKSCCNPEKTPPIPPFINYFKLGLASYAAYSLTMSAIAGFQVPAVLSFIPSLFLQLWDM